MPQRLRIAALQPPLRWQQTMPNMYTLRGIVDNLPASVDVVVLPEMWPGLPHGADTPKNSADCTQFLQNLARKRSITVVGGSFESLSDDGARQNVCPVIDRQGGIIDCYAKRLLFAREKDNFQAGTRATILDLDGFRLAVLICADLWSPDLVRELAGQADVICVPVKTSVPSDNHIDYARTLWHSLALTRAMEYGLAIVVSDWPAARHTPRDVDMSVGSVHAPGMDYDRGVLHKRHRDAATAPTAAGPVEPTATAHTSATPALGSGVHFTAGAATICNPAHRPDIDRIQRVCPRGEQGLLIEEIDLEALHRYREYRRAVGLLPPARGA